MKIKIKYGNDDVIRGDVHRQAIMLRHLANALEEIHNAGFVTDRDMITQAYNSEAVEEDREYIQKAQAAFAQVIEESAKAVREDKGPEKSDDQSESIIPVVHADGGLSVVNEMTGEVLAEVEAKPTEPAATEKPKRQRRAATEAPVTESPVTAHPVTEQVTEAPVTEPPVTAPPATEAPATASAKQEPDLYEVGQRAHAIAREMGTVAGASVVREKVREMFGNDANFTLLEPMQKVQLVRAMAAVHESYEAIYNKIGLPEGV